MVNATSSGAGLSNASSVYLAQQLQAANAPAALNSLTGAAGTPTSATISGPGELLANLQQLQTQDPAKFQQVTSQIANQLQAAAQQAQGTQSNFLSNLAAKFQSVASGGNLSQLQPQQQQHHHHHPHAQQAYSQGAQSQPQGIAGLAPSSSQSSNGSTLQQLFTSISAKVSQAIG